MNILYNHRTRATGADGNHIRHVAEAFRQLRHSVDIVSPAGVDIYPEAVKAKINWREKFIGKLRFSIPQFLFELLEIIYNFVHIRRVANAFNKKKYDMIYERYAIYNITGVLTAIKNNVPIVLEVSFISKTFVIPERNKLLKYFAIKIDRFIFKNSTAIITVTERLKKEVMELGADENKIIVLPNAADTDKFNPNISSEKIRKFYGLNGKKVIGFIGGFYPWHGLDLLIKAVDKICVKDNSIIVLIVGEGLLREKMEKMVLDTGLKNNFIFTGRVAHDEIPEYIATFDVGVMPDSNDYGSPMKILEYMAMGKPVVAPRLKPIEKLITHGIHGLLFEKGNINEMCAVLINLLNDASLREKMGKSARGKVINEHTWVKNAESFLRFLKQLS